MTADKKAQKIIEYIWSVWYGHHRGVMNSEQMSDLLTEAKMKIVALLDNDLLNTPMTNFSRQSQHLPSFDNEQWKHYGYLHGSYQNHCYTCKKAFMGAKNSTACWNCANNALQAEKAKPKGRTHEQPK